MACAAALAACGSSATIKDDEYKNALALPPLEVPPDLINPPKDAALAVPAVPAGGAAIAAAPRPAPPETAAAAPAAPVSNPQGRLERDGAQRWLVVSGEVAAVTKRVHEFLLQEGYDIAAEDAARGNIETEWRAADAGRAGDNDKEKLNEALSAGLQDKFRIRLEAGRSPGTVEIYVSHLGLQRVTADGADKWQPRAARRIGFALGRGGFVIEDRNRNDGLYLIRLGRAFKEDAKAGFFGRLFGASGGDPDAQYRVFLKGMGDETTVVVQHPGGAVVRTSIGERILNRLQEKME